MNSELIEKIKKLPDKANVFAILRGHEYEQSYPLGTADTLKQLAADYESLTEILQNCIDAIETLPQDVLGVGGDGETHWYIRDELIGRAKEAVRGETIE